MRERVITIGEEKRLVGILTEPKQTSVAADRPCVLLLNAGRLHRVGPNRLHVKIARRLAPEGYCVCRFDFSGVGDSPSQDHPSSVREYAPGETIRVLNHLEENLGAKRFILFGICLGADVAFQTAARDPRVVGAMLVNGSFLDTGDLEKIRPIAEKKAQSRYYRKRLFSLSHWRRMLSGKSNIWGQLSSKKNDAHSKQKSDAMGNFSSRSDSAIASEAWQATAERRIPLYFLYSEGSPYLDIFRLTREKELQRLAEGSAIQFEVLPDIDHVFTLLWSQELLLEKIRDWFASHFTNGDYSA